MNCLDFRRACQADPQHLTAEQQAHRLQCRACHRFAAEQLDFDRRLASALRVPAPDGLTQRVIFERSLRGRRRRTGWLAMAASILVVIGVTAAVLIPQPAADADSFAAHMEKHPVEQVPLAAPQSMSLQRVAANLALPAVADLSAIVRAELCVVDGHRGAHLVVDVGEAPVTAFVMPGMTGEQISDLTGVPGLASQVVRTRDGLILLFCPDQSRLAELGERMRRQLGWRA